jgi:hypothetical protein
VSAAPARVFLSAYASQLALFVPAIALPCIAVLGPGGREARRLALLPAASFAAIAGLFSVYAPPLGQDEVRRLAVVWPTFGLLLALAVDTLPLTGRTLGALAAANLALGVYWFQLREFIFHTPAGTPHPAVLWLDWLLEGRPAEAALYVLGTVAGGGLALFALRRRERGARDS